ncbi:response regulator [Planococcus lenghuensis]|uniref:Transcriptional regulatory protein n=1 Tax=Planococcus lenghuensis TaxID=2213202 RepID=A0A1Q2L2I1_9BACL|nr:response regulator [Planococcus lenghuensis]AQQ54092.1 two-component system response regulator DcuR [Planococcus lenghuensis]
MINVMVVEDDPMVAALNQQYIQQIDGFTCVGIAGDTDTAVGLLKEMDVDLILLDIHMPGGDGIEFMGRLREQKEDVDVILITAASEIHQIQQALRLGAIDYLIKPFEFSRFQEALVHYQNQYAKLDDGSKISQRELDRLLRKKGAAKPESVVPGALPKGLTKATLLTVRDAVQAAGPGVFSTEDIAQATNISRVSVRKYLKFLTDIAYLEETLVYGVGRPIYQYQLNEPEQHRIDPYI